MLLNLSQILILSALTIFIFVYIAINFRIKSSFVGTWLMGWIVFYIAVLLLLILPAESKGPLSFVLLHSLIILSGLLLLYGTHHFFAKRFSPIWIFSSAIVIGWMLIGSILQRSPQMNLFPGIFLIAILEISNGLIWLRSNSSTGKQICAWAFILLGLQHLSTPFLRINFIFIPWTYMITFSLAATAILGAFQVYVKSRQKELRDSEMRFRLLAENANDLVYRYRLAFPPGYEYVSPSVIHFNGYTPEEHYADPDLLYKSVHPDDQYMFSLLGKKLSHPKKIFWQRFVRKDGSIICTEQRYEYIYDEQGSIMAIQGIIRDITERQQMEKQIEYVSAHDPLTNLYNRSFFEEKLILFEDYGLTPIGIIVCDLDGLKLVNDSMGHDTGDQLLIHAAEILKYCSHSEDVVARIGGDEFAVIMLDSDEKRTGEIADSINKTIENYNLDNPHSLLSLSVGFAIKADPSQKLQELLKEADHNMYQKKLFRSQSIRSTVVSTLTTTLRERDYITEGHSDRLEDLVTQLGRKHQLSDARIANMRLFAHFHDIGKVGIPDNILFKPGPLSQAEQREMRRHSEIGYRLAQSGPELFHISDWILKHHEWWNGNGYPLGISGEEIPLESRILAIADAYDAMVSSRAYREGVSPPEALAELKRCAGTQFDPNLVELFVEIIQTKSEDEKVKIS